METTIVQPGSSPSIYTTGERHYGDRHHDRHDSVESRADFRSLTAEVERFGVANGDRITSGTLGTADRICSSTAVTGDRVNAAAAAAAVAACHTDRLVQSSASGIHDRLCDSTGKIVHEIDRHGDAAALAACRINEGIADVKFHGMETAKDQIIAQNVGFSAQSVLSQTIGNATQVLVNAVANQLGNQATNNFNGTTVQIERVRAELDSKLLQGFSAQLLETTKVAAAAELRAANIASAAAAKAAECCCELKALITAEGVAGRALANEIEARRVQNELQRLQTQVTVLTGGVLGGAARAS